MAIESDLWREQSAAKSEAYARGSGDAKRAGKEGLADVLVVAEPSSRLAGARDGSSPGAGGRKSRPTPPPAALVASRMASMALYVDQCRARP